MPTIFLEHKGGSNMPGEFQQGFFDFSIKWENLVLFGFGCRSQFIQPIDGVESAFGSCFSSAIIFPLEIEAFPKQRLKVGDRA